LIDVFATIVAIASARSSVGSSGQQMAFVMVDCCVCDDGRGESEIFGQKLFFPKSQI
jgi:hypothetical protein